ncbi:Flp family type IVb pilin [Alicyclobacillus sp. ALC3]|uniref:Flp family type IVb pilin n=1 Tax=Alicyclobacillus sp. ALC3 TaxID=2796143 RepID=UPI002377F7FD|nr:Flp family type IVb pilin [Alicyclobacillus sp. ALC3]WDL95380.1 Flp family type IVb pilin [Alicyclobacillus sp. ALC3]
MGRQKHIPHLKSYFLSDRGQGFTEYGLILGAVAVVAIVVLVVVGTQVQGMHQRNANAVNQVASSKP